MVIAPFALVVSPSIASISRISRLISVNPVFGSSSSASISSSSYRTLLLHPIVTTTFHLLSLCRPSYVKEVNYVNASLPTWNVLIAYLLQSTSAL